MSDASVTTVEFLGSTLWGLRGNTPAATMVGMKALVEGMGLDWSSQHQKLKVHPVLAGTMGLIPMVGEDGKLREAATMPLRKLPFWLATIQTGRIPDKMVRERVVAFQQRVCDVLEDAFFGPAKVAEPDETIVVRPWHLRPLEERNTELRTVSAIGRFGNHACAWHYIYSVLGIRDFPRRILPGWHQAEFDTTPRPTTARAMIVLDVNTTGEAH